MARGNPPLQPLQVALYHLHEVSPKVQFRILIYCVLLPSRSWHPCLCNQEPLVWEAWACRARRGGGRGEIRHSAGVSQCFCTGIALVPTNRMGQEKEMIGKPNCHHPSILQVENPVQICGQNK